LRTGSCRRRRRRRQRPHRWMRWPPGSSGGERKP
jgi:hypothetical protein